MQLSTSLLTMYCCCCQHCGGHGVDVADVGAPVLGAAAETQHSVVQPASLPPPHHLHRLHFLHHRSVGDAMQSASICSTVSVISV